MGIWDWIAHNSFDLLSAVGIVGGLWFTGISLHSESKTRHTANLLTLTQNHREIWSDYYRRPQLARVLDASADLSKEPMTRAEETFANIVIQHIHSVYQATRNDLLKKPEGFARDVRQLFSLPIFKSVWERIGSLQDKDFAAFIESCRREC